MSAARIILGPLIAAFVRHAIFAIALPWFILYRTAGIEEMGFDSSYPTAGSVLILLGAALYVRAFAERIRMTAMVSADEPVPERHDTDPGTSENQSAEYAGRASHDETAGDARPIWSEGVHGRSRNPLQLGVVVILFGAFLTFESLALLVYALLYWAWLTLYLALVEEPALRRTLGDEYLDYHRRVPRWFLPFRFRKPA